MTLPTWNKMKMDVKLSAKKRYELLRSEINGLSNSQGTDYSSDISDIKARLDALEQPEDNGES